MSCIRPEENQSRKDVCWCKDNENKRFHLKMHFYLLCVCLCVCVNMSVHMWAPWLLVDLKGRVVGTGPLLLLSESLSIGITSTVCLQVPRLLIHLPCPKLSVFKLWSFWLVMALLDEHVGFYFYVLQIQMKLVLLQDQFWCLV